MKIIFQQAWEATVYLKTLDSLCQKSNYVWGFAFNLNEIMLLCCEKGVLFG